MNVYSKHIRESEKNVHEILERVHNNNNNNNNNHNNLFFILFPNLKGSSSIQKMFLQSKNVNEYETASYIQKNSKQN